MVQRRKKSLREPSRLFLISLFLISALLFSTLLFSTLIFSTLIFSGEGGIRTRGGLLARARLASEYLRPLGHLSKWGAESSGCGAECKPGLTAFAGRICRTARALDGRQKWLERAEMRSS